MLYSVSSQDKCCIKKSYKLGSEKRRLIGLVKSARLAGIRWMDSTQKVLVSKRTPLVLSLMTIYKHYMKDIISWNDKLQKVRATKVEKTLSIWNMVACGFRKMKQELVQWVTTLTARKLWILAKEECSHGKLYKPW